MSYCNIGRENASCNVTECSCFGCTHWVSIVVPDTSCQRFDNDRCTHEDSLPDGTLFCSTEDCPFVI